VRRARCGARRKHGPTGLPPRDERRLLRRRALQRRPAAVGRRGRGAPSDVHLGRKRDAFGRQALQRAALLMRVRRCALRLGARGAGRRSRGLRVARGGPLTAPQRL